MSSTKSRGKLLAWAGGAASLGVIFGPALSSYFIGINWLNEYSWVMLKSNSYTLPFVIAGSFSLIALYVAAFLSCDYFLPENLKRPANLSLL